MSLALETLHPPFDLTAYAGADLYRGFDPMLLAAQDPTAHVIALRSGVPVAHTSVWATSLPKFEGRVAGALGHYAAIDDEAAGAVIDEALSLLECSGCEIAIGPIDGNTWRSYRFVTGTSQEPPFFLEPNNPPEYPAQLERAGFEPLTTYYSSLTTDLSHHDERLDRVQRRLDDDRIRIGHIDVGSLDAELAAIYDVSIEAFSDAYLYTPIDKAEFVAQYRAVIPAVRPELVLLARDAEERVVGFAFGLPDTLRARRGEPLDTMIVKTVAVLPGRRYAGLGAVLVERLHSTGLALGYTRAIHALMHESNSSRNLSGHYAETIRRYTLFAKRFER